MATWLRPLLKAAVLSLLLVPAPATAQSTGYPTGEAIEVYRAALDLLYTDDNDRPAVIVLLDSVAPRSIGPCPQCPWAWRHQSKIDTATIQAYGSPPYGTPPIRKFAYKVPIHVISRDSLHAMFRAGEAYAARHPNSDGRESPMISGFRRRFPGAWGWAQFTVVGFNPARTEALLGIHQHCGQSCDSREMVFFRKINGKWTPIERVPAAVRTELTDGTLRYRGPNVKDTTESELLSRRPEYARDDPGVYRAVLDSLYSFHGERPGMVVIAPGRVMAPAGVTASSKRIAAAKISSSDFLAAASSEMLLGIRLLTPVKFLTRESRQVLERGAAALEQRLMYRPDGEEPTGFWRAFRARYPEAWGYAELSRVGYNADRTMALVYSVHRCGEMCYSGDAWLLNRNGKRWTVADRIGREESELWYLDSLRYLGRGARVAWYQAGRARGVFQNRATGGVFRNLDVDVHHNRRLYRTLRTDADGRYAMRTPRFGIISWKTLCPAPHRDTLDALDFQLTRGMDTTVNVEFEPRRCLRLARTHPWIAGDLPAKAPASTVPTQVADIYRSVLNFLLPVNDSGRVLVQAHRHYICEHCLAREVPRLLRKGLIKLSTETDFVRAARDSGPPPIFPYRRKISVFPAGDQEFLRGAPDFWDVMKDAYPGVRSIVSFSKIGFDDQRTEALVEFRLETPGQTTGPEMVLLRKSGADWRVALRDVSRPATSGEWSAGKCEPTDAPPVGPRLVETRTLVGTYMIVRVHASTEARGSTDTAWVRLSPIRPPSQPRTPHSSEVRVLDARQREQPKVKSNLEAWEGGAKITYQERLPEGVIQFDGWYAHDEILRIDPRAFYGRWVSQSGPTVPYEGHFCARKIGR